MCFCPLTTFVDAPLDSLQYVSVFLILLSPNPDVMPPSRSYKGQIEEITISLNLPAMMLLMQPGTSLTLIAAEAHCRLLFNLFGLRTSSSFSAKLLSSQPAPRLCFCMGCFCIRCGTRLVFWPNFMLFVAVRFSGTLRSLQKAALPSMRQIDLSPRFEFGFGTRISNSRSLLMGKRIKAVLIPGKCHS